MTEKDVIALLDKKYSPNRPRWEGYATFSKLKTGTSLRPECQQEIDYFSISLHRSSDDEITAYEIKLSRADFLNEIKNPQKRKYALLFSNQYYFVAPENMIKPEELPVECGLMEIKDCSSGKQLIMKIRAPWRDDARPNWHFVRSIARRVSRAEEMK